MPRKTFKTVLYEKKARLATITLNRPEALNAINSKMLGELELILEDLGTDEQVSVVVITGSGRAFCAGEDLKESVRLDTKGAQLEALRYTKLAQGFKSLDKVVVAAVNGYALAGGCELAMLADLVVASEDASFGYPEVKIGVLSGMGNFHILPLVVGEKKAKELFLLGDMISAKEAARIGMVNAVVPAKLLNRRVADMVRKILRNAPLSVMLSKLATDVGIGSNLGATLSYETEALAETFQSDDYAEGLRAFAEKREPRFKGR